MLANTESEILHFLFNVLSHNLVFLTWSRFVRLYGLVINSFALKYTHFYTLQMYYWL